MSLALVLSLARVDLQTLRELYLLGMRKEVKLLLTSNDYRQPYFHLQMETLAGRSIDHSRYFNVDWGLAYSLARQGLLHWRGGDYLRLSLELGMTKWSLGLAGYHAVPVEKLRTIIDLGVSRFELADALIDACELNHVEVVKLLLEDGRADVASEKHRAIMSACSRGYTEIVRLFMEDGRVNLFEDCECIAQACAYGRTEVVAMFLADTGANSVSFTDRSYECMHYALVNNQIEVIRLLMADPRVTLLQTDLVDACTYGHMEIARLLLDDGRLSLKAFDADYLCQEPLKATRAELRDILATYGRTTEGGFKSSYLALACVLGEVEIVSAILKRKDLKPCFVDRCLWRAVERNDEPIVRKLLADDRFNPGGPCNPASFSNYVLELALHNKSSGALKILLSSPKVKANLNVKQQMECYTILHR